MKVASSVEDLSADALAGVIIDEYLERLSRGERPEVEEYAARYPDLADVLRQMLPMLQVMRWSASHCSEGVAIPREDALLEDLLGDFRIVREVGRGGMGVVYEAQQLSLGRRVALKVLPLAAALDSRQLVRFQTEARAAAALHHEHIVPIHAVGSERGVHFYAMQFIDGRTLADFITELRRGPSNDTPRLAPSTQELLSAPACSWEEEGVDVNTQPPQPRSREEEDQRGEMDAGPREIFPTPRAPRPEHVRQVAEWARQAAEALEHAHQIGIVHRDVKPANLLIDSRGHLWVADFGLAHVQADSRLTMTGDLLGTLRYMSPEQALGQPGLIDHRTDVYGLGATLYELLTLEPAFDGRDRQELLRQIANDEPRPPRQHNRGIPADLETIVLKAMAKVPAERYATARDFGEDLERFLGDRPIQARRPTLAQRLWKWARRHRAVVGAVAACLAVAAVVAAGAIGWWLRELADRRGRTAQAVEAALKDSGDRQRQARIPEALEAGRRAEAALAAGEGSAAYRGKVRERVRDLEMLATLEGIYIRKGQMRYLEFSESAIGTWKRFGPLRNGQWKPFHAKVRIDEEMTTAFEEYGIPVEKLDPREAGKRIRERSVAVELAAALDDWATFRKGTAPPDDTSWKHLRAVARAADFDEWRTRVRDALEKEDKDALVQVAEQDAAASLPMVSRILLSEALANLGERDKVVAYLRVAQQKSPDDFWLNFQLGNHLSWPFRAGGAEEAIRFYAAALAARPQNASVQLNLASAIRTTGALDEAIAAYRRAIDLDPAMFFAHLGLGDVLEEKGLLEEAIAAYEQAIRLRPRDASAYCNLGPTLAKLKRFDEAAAALRRAISLEADGETGHFNLGVVLREQGLPAEAVPVLREALRLRPDDFLTLINLAEALNENGTRDEALDNYRAAFERRPRHPQLLLDLGVTLRDEGLYDEAITAFRDAIRLKPDLTEAHASLGDAFHARKQLDEAAAAYREAIRLKPDYAMAHYNLGLVLAAKRSFDEALDHYREAIRLQPDMASAYVSFGAVLCDEKRDYDGAIAAFEHAIRLRKNDDVAHDNLGVARAGKRDYAGAIAAYREAIRLNPDNPQRYWKLAAAYAAGQDHDKAIAAYREAIRRKPDLFDAHFGLGKALIEKGLLPKAIESFREAIRLKPDHAWSHSYLGDLLREANEQEQAVEAYGRALKLWRGLAADFPQVALYQSQVAATLNNLATVHLRDNQPGKAVPQLEAAVAFQKSALRIEPENPRFRAFLRNHYWNLAEALVRQGEHARAAKVSAELPLLYPDGWEECVRAAGYLARCAAAAGKDADVPRDKRKELIEVYGSEAVGLLRRAVAKGWNEAGGFKVSEFDSLRERDDFKKLLVEVENKNNP